MTLFIIVAALLISFYLLERKIIQDYQKELDKYGIKVELEHSLGQPWEVDDE